MEDVSDYLPLQFAQLSFHKVNVPGTNEFNVYMFAALNGSCVFAYML